MQKSTRMAAARAEFHTVVVQRQHGYRHHIHPTPQLAIQWQMAAIHFLRHLRVERAAVHHILGNLNREVHIVSQDLGGNDSAPYSELVSGHIPHGPGDHYQHDGVCDCAFLGWTVVESYVGDLVD